MFPFSPTNIYNIITMASLTVKVVFCAAISLVVFTDYIQGETTPDPTNGTVEVVPAGTQVCGPECKIFCLCGKVLDDKGCPTCKCKECNESYVAPVGCPPLPCAKTPKCPWGVKKVDGCPVCECDSASPHCPPADCSASPKCRYGYSMIQGCPTCNCNSYPPGCQQLECPKGRKCPYGVLKVRGCPTCICRRRPVCRPRLCLLWRRRCRYGYKKVNGCPTCQCNRPRCPNQQLRCKPCRYRNRIIVGCRACTCIRRSLLLIRI